MREHSNTCTKRPLKDNKMTLIYSVCHGLPPKSSIGICQCLIWASTNMSTNNNLLLPQPPPPPPTMPTHNAHPQCPPIVATPPLPTTDNHLEMPVHHPNDAGLPHQQPAGQWEATMMTWHINRHLTVTALCPAPGKHPQPVPTVPFLTMK